MTDVKRKVYELLFELFGDECPYIKKYISKETFVDDIKGMYEKFETILTLILPRYIKYKECKYEPVIFGRFNINYCEYDDINDKLRDLFEIWDEPDFYKSVFNLLKAIQNHPQRNDMKFVWGKK